VADYVLRHIIGFCVADHLVSQAATSRVVEGGPRSEGHITDDRGPNPTWALGGQSTGPLNFQLDRDPCTNRDRLDGVFNNPESRRLGLAAKSLLIAPGKGIEIKMLWVVMLA
jgi:hypothetical protein